MFACLTFKYFELKSFICSSLLLLCKKKIDFVTNKVASTVFCSVGKLAGSCTAQTKCREKHETQSSVFPHFLSALQLPKCFTTEQSTVEAYLFVLS